MIADEVQVHIQRTIDHRSTPMTTPQPEQDGPHLSTATSAVRYHLSSAARLLERAGELAQLLDHPHVSQLAEAAIAATRAGVDESLIHAAADLLKGATARKIQDDLKRAFPDGSTAADPFAVPGGRTGAELPGVPEVPGQLGSGHAAPGEGDVAVQLPPSGQA